MSNVSSYRKGRINLRRKSIHRFLYDGNAVGSWLTITSQIFKKMWFYSHFSLLAQYGNVQMLFHIRSKNRDILIYQFIYISFFSLSVLHKQLFLLLTDDLQIRKCLSNLIKSFIGSYCFYLLML